jgi:TPR repeat protein
MHIESGVNLLGIAADQGYVRAMDLLGFLYDKAVVKGRQNIDMAFYWFGKSAESGSVAGNQYVCKYHVLKKDFKSAAPYCITSAEQGIPMSQAIVGEMYYRGQGVPKDKKIGANYLCRAASGGRRLGNTVTKYGMNCNSEASD